ncbi:MAG: hypothetical protein ACTSXK_11515 [Promethearchaeota archaeon]
MENYEILKVKNYRKALFIAIIVFWASIGGFLLYTYKKPLLSTSYYHANIQFRAGKEETYDQVFRNSLEHIVDMYDKHPSWKWTLECQGLLLDMAYQNYTDIFQKIQNQNTRGQLEIISPQYSDALVLAYPYKDFAESIEYNHHLLTEILNLTISNVMVLQEGQWLPAFPLMKKFGFDTMVVSRDQFSYENYYPREPLLEYNYRGNQAYVMPVAWLPAFEGGVFHHQLVLSDSERVNTGDIENPTNIDFPFNSDKQKELENRHIELEKRGNIWMTMSEWVDYCIKNEYIGSMTKFMPESHWTPYTHENLRWMSWNTGDTIDSSMLARNYFTRQRIQIAQIIIEKAKPSLNASDLAYCENLMQKSLINLWLAEVTDTTGVNPRDYEFEYGIHHSYLAQKGVDQIIEFIQNRLSQFNQTFQVNTYNRRIITDTMEFTNNTIIESSLTIEDLESKYDFDLNIYYKHQNLHPYSLKISNQSLDTIINETLYKFEFEKLSLSFIGPYNISVNNYQKFLSNLTEANYTACNLERSEQYIYFDDDWSKIHYTPSLDNNGTIGLTRSDYSNKAMVGDPFYKVALPICNGLLYNDQGNYAIIMNNSVGRLAVVWKEDTAYYSEQYTEYNGSYEFIFYKGSLENALLFASLVNTYPTLEVQK